MKEIYQFNRVNGLKFLYNYFPYYYDSNRIKLFFVSSKKDLKKVKVDKKYDIYLLKRSTNKSFVSDLKFKDNRFFNSLKSLKEGAEEFRDVFDFCIECHKFKKGEGYYSDRLAIAQFSTDKTSNFSNRLSFIPSIVPGVNTRDNMPYIEVEFPYNSEKLYHITSFDKNQIKKNGFDNFSISYCIQKIYQMIENIKEYLIELNISNSFQLIVRIDSNLNLLPIDFRTPNSWINIK